MSADDTAALAREWPAFAEVPAGRLPDGQQTGGFGLAVVPTTAGQFRRYLADQVQRTRGGADDGGSGQAPALLPVTGVTWPAALAYCEWLGSRTGVPCRLPSAAEWQYAAAGPLGHRWALGDEFDRKTYAPAASAPRPVGCTPANAFGLRDMTGNIFEWCADPLTAEGAVLPARVIKGGAYTVRNPESFENATVFTADELSAVPYIGFRVLRASGS